MFAATMKKRSESNRAIPGMKPGSNRNETGSNRNEVGKANSQNEVVS